jgi:hypothetical protein
MSETVTNVYSKGGNVKYDFYKNIVNSWSYIIGLIFA